MLTLATKVDVEFIVGVSHAPDWTEINSYVFKKDNGPHGLISTQMHDEVLLINSISKDDGHYTFGMVKYLANLIKTHDKVVLMSTVEHSTTINKLMDRYVSDGINSYFIKGF